jgi:hypothetical protein
MEFLPFNDGYLPVQTVPSLTPASIIDLRATCGVMFHEEA